MIKLIRNYLNNDPVNRHTDTMLGYAKTRLYEPGRLETGYLKSRITESDARMSRVMHYVTYGCLYRVLTKYGEPIDPNYWQSYDGRGWDAYFLYYPDKSYIPPHVDKAGLFGLRHIRMNVLLNNDFTGGVLHMDGKPYHLFAGDAIIFFPDEVEHSVDPVYGERYMLSVGALIKTVNDINLDGAVVR